MMKFQQVTGPVIAKGLEDTAFYIYNRLISLNEVGGEPELFGISPAAFHKQQAERLRNWPDSMLTTSTHDTKRSEDVRVRINVLSEMPKRMAHRGPAVGQAQSQAQESQSKGNSPRAPTRNTSFTRPCSGCGPSRTRSPARNTTN